ncbi:TPA: hypothetical protein DDW35_03730, partial [Candidatus Sumerlaeota bacterium]|nr:hypothetical protein [Candidatus Sumerlaeota bacterium]
MTYHIGGIADDSISYTVTDSSKKVACTGTYGGTLWAESLTIDPTPLLPGTYKITAQFVNTSWGAGDPDGFSLYKIRKDVPAIDHIERYDPSTKKWVAFDEKDCLVGAKVKVRAIPPAKSVAWPTGCPAWYSGKEVYDPAADNSGLTLLGTGAECTITIGQSTTTTDYTYISALSDNVISAKYRGYSAKLKSVRYGPNYPMVHDDGTTAYDNTIHWQVADKTAGTAEIRNPVCSTRNAELNANIVLETIPTGASELFKGATVTGTGPVAFTGSIVAPAAGNSTVGAYVTGGKADNRVRYYPTFAEAWKLVADGATVTVGTSQNPYYLTWADPQPTNLSGATRPLYRTLVHVGCQGANGTAGTVGKQDTTVLAGMWNAKFKTKSIIRTDTNTSGKPVLLTYYGYYSKNNNSKYNKATDENHNGCNPAFC